MCDVIHMLCRIIIGIVFVTYVDVLKFLQLDAILGINAYIW